MSGVWLAISCVLRKKSASTITKTRNAKKFKKHRSRASHDNENKRTVGGNGRRNSHTADEINSTYLFSFFFSCLLTEFVELSTYYRPRAMITRWLWCFRLHTIFFICLPVTIDRSSILPVPLSGTFSEQVLLTRLTKKKKKRQIITKKYDLHSKRTSFLIIKIIWSYLSSLVRLL